jgi:hypothetical protein
MTFLEVLEQVRRLLQSQGRISYRALKRQFNVDDEYVADLREELLFAHPQVRDEDGRGLVWVGVSPVSGSTFQVSRSQPLAPNTLHPGGGGARGSHRTRRGSISQPKITERSLLWPKRSAGIA